MLVPRSDCFGDDYAGRARQRLAFQLAPACLTKPCLGLFLTVSLTLPSDNQKLTCHESRSRRLTMGGIHPQIGEKKPCARRDLAAESFQQLNVMLRREHMNGVCHDQGVVALG